MSLQAQACQPVLGASDWETPSPHVLRGLLLRAGQAAF